MAAEAVSVEVKALFVAKAEFAGYEIEGYTGAEDCSRIEGSCER